MSGFGIAEGYTRARAEFPARSVAFRRRALADRRLDDLREGGARPVQPRLHRPEVAAGDLGDLLVRFPFELAQHEHLPVMLGEARDRDLHHLAEVAAPVHVIRT